MSESKQKIDREVVVTGLTAKKDQEQGGEISYFVAFY